MVDHIIRLFLPIILAHGQSWIQTNCSIKGAKSKHHVIKCFLRQFSTYIVMGQLQVNNWNGEIMSVFNPEIE